MNSDSRATLQALDLDVMKERWQFGYIDQPTDIGAFREAAKDVHRLIEEVERLRAALLLREGRQREAKDPEGWCPHCGTLKGGWHAKGCEYERFKPRPNVEEGVGASPLDDVLANVNAALTKAGSRHIVGTKDGQIVSCTIDEIIDGRYRNGERVTVIDAERKER